MNEPSEGRQYLYVLQLADDCFYVGRTSNLPRRHWQHFRSAKNNGSSWTELHATKSVLHCSEVRGDKIHLDFLENQCTLRLARLKGFDNVRGGAYCSSDQPPPKAWVEAAANVTPADESKFQPIAKKGLQELVRDQYKGHAEARRQGLEKKGGSLKFLAVPISTR